MMGFGSIDQLMLITSALLLFGNQEPRNSLRGRNSADIKVPPSHFSQNPDLSFPLRECGAKAISSLQHPHNCMPQGGSMRRQRQPPVGVEVSAFCTLR